MDSDSVLVAKVCAPETMVQLLRSVTTTDDKLI